jgi:hypothetical protein
MQFVHVFTNAGQAIILENLNFCKTKFENELNLRTVFKYCLKISLFFKVNMNFSGWRKYLSWSLQHCHDGEVDIDLMPPENTKFFSFLFCIIWAASVRRLKSLLGSGFLLLTMK